MKPRTPKTPKHVKEFETYTEYHFSGTFVRIPHELKEVSAKNQFVRGESK